MTTKATYTARKGTLPAKMIEYFKRNPDEELTRSDIAAKFNVASSAIDAGLAVAIDAGAIRQRNNEEMVRVWVAGTASVRKSRGELPALPDPDSLVIESGVPIPEPRKGATAAYVGLFSKLKPGESFTVSKAVSKRVLDTATRWGKKNDGKFALRAVDDTTARIWRTA